MHYVQKPRFNLHQNQIMGDKLHFHHFRLLFDSKIFVIFNDVFTRIISYFKTCFGRSILSNHFSFKNRNDMPVTMTIYFD